MEELAGLEEVLSEHIVLIAEVVAEFSFPQQVGFMINGAVSTSSIGLLVKGEDNRTIFNPFTGSQIAYLSDEVGDYAYSCNERVFAVGKDNFKIYDLLTGQLVASLPEKVNQQPLVINKNYFLMSLNNKELYDAETGKKVTEFPQAVCLDGVVTVVYGKALVKGEDRHSFYDLLTGTQAFRSPFPVGPDVYVNEIKNTIIMRNADNNKFCELRLVKTVVCPIQKLKQKLEYVERVAGLGSNKAEQALGSDGCDETSTSSKPDEYTPEQEWVDVPEYSGGISDA